MVSWFLSGLSSRTETWILILSYWEDLLEVLSKFSYYVTFLDGATVNFFSSLGIKLVLLLVFLGSAFWFLSTFKFKFDFLGLALRGVLA